MESLEYCGYMVREDGEVKRVDGSVVTSKIDVNGYVKVNFNARSHFAHRLVAHLWLGLRLEDRSGQVDHINNNRSSNHWSNLQIVSSGENKILATKRAFPHDDESNKTCRRCRELKDISHFCKDKKRADGRGVYCRSCVKIQSDIREANRLIVYQLTRSKVPN